MKTKIWLLLLAVLILFLALYVVALIAGAPKTEAPATTGSTFHGPTGVPYVKGPSGPPPGALLQECPDAWFDNQMPSVGTPTLPSQYFIVKGARRELSEFDLDWVRKNCNIQPQVVH